LKEPVSTSNASTQTQSNDVSNHGGVSTLLQHAN